ncbi:hypothetical protein [Pseudaminobacter soli (ex Li et al. 2025)]|uniref:hypothetical protein n=1 Tax=Pseudaminobacter soli (ex Li et al. 2025) TaxID=1295366 RepID=UPI0024758AE0|nr:hypothetical protein [Mesorhizobium soli]
MRSKARAFCLSVTDFTNPPIGLALGFDAFHDGFNAHLFGNAFLYLDEIERETTCKARGCRDGDTSAFASGLHKPER